MTLQKQLEYNNIPEWHKNGVTGKGINVWNTEGLSEHGKMVDVRLLHSAPDCNILKASISMKHNNTEILYSYADYDGKRMELEELIRDYKVQIITRSIGGSSKTGGVVSKFWNGIKERNNVSIFNSAGNEGSKGTTGAFPPDVSSYIAAANLVKGRPVRANYSSIGEAVDFINFTGDFTGTSFAAPYTAGMVALLRQRYGEMSDEEVYKYLVMISQDMNEEGKDEHTGHGLPILPPFKNKYITLTVGEKKYFVDGKEHEADTFPVNIDGNVFVPLRVIAEGLNKKVDWGFSSDKTINVTITDSKNKITLNTESNIMFKNGAKVILNFEPYIDGNNRTMVPIRAIAEAFNCKVDWVQRERKVMILEV
jgi:hypothetical protein